MESKGRGAGGKTALHVLAYIGVTLLLLVIAAAAALFIATKGPSASAREAVYGWASERGLGPVAGVFLSQEELAAMADVPGENAPEEDGAEGGEAPLIVVTDGLPAASGAPEEGEEPEAGETPAAGEEPEADGEEGQA